jgi:hypothetical protein
LAFSLLIVRDAIVYKDKSNTAINRKEGGVNPYCEVLNTLMIKVSELEKRRQNNWSIARGKIAAWRSSKRSSSTLKLLYLIIITSQLCSVLYR